jgi:RimJ/RimL family protein N-acetyltransferase
VSAPVDPLLIDIPTALRGDRVLVRLLVDADAQALFEAIDTSRDHLAPWMPWAAAHTSLNDSLGYIRRSQAQWLLRERLPVGIFEAATEALVGGSGLERLDWRLRAFEIGYWLRASAQGHGYVQETVQLLTTLAFTHLGAKRVQIRMDPRNERSERVAQRLGFELEGTLRNVSLDADGAPADRRIYALSPDTYAALPWAGALPPHPGPA